MVTARQLAAVPLLRGVDERLLEQLANHAEERHVESGDAVVRQHEEARPAFFLVRCREPCGSVGPTRERDSEPLSRIDPPLGEAPVRSIKVLIRDILELSETSETCDARGRLIVQRSCPTSQAHS